MAGRTPQPWHLKEGIGQPTLAAFRRHRGIWVEQASPARGKLFHQLESASLPPLQCQPLLLCQAVSAAPGYLVQRRCHPLMPLSRTIRGSAYSLGLQSPQPHTSLADSAVFPSALPSPWCPRLPPKINWLSASESENGQKAVLQDKHMVQRRIGNLEGNANGTDGRNRRSSQR